MVSSQLVITALMDVGAEVSVQERLAMTLDDFAILTTLLPVMAVCFLVGFIVASLCVRFIGGKPAFWFIAAGASSIVCTLLLMSWVMNLMPVAGARTTVGLVLIGLCGAMGGLLFSSLTRSSNN